VKLTGDRNQCPSCSLFFKSTAAFEKHRTGVIGVDRRCRTVEEMELRGMACRDGWWVSSVNPRFEEKNQDQKESA
jgi:hypothetical protein